MSIGLTENNIDNTNFIHITDLVEFNLVQYSTRGPALIYTTLFIIIQ